MKLGNEEILIGEYRNLIQIAVKESECKWKLNSKLKVIMKAATFDGIPEKAIGNLIAEVTTTTKNIRVA